MQDSGLGKTLKITSLHQMVRKFVKNCMIFKNEWVVLKMGLPILEIKRNAN